MLTCFLLWKPHERAWRAGPFGLALRRVSPGPLSEESVNGVKKMLTWECFSSVRIIKVIVTIFIIVQPGSFTHNLTGAVLSNVTATHHVSY